MSKLGKDALISNYKNLAQKLGRAPFASEFYKEFDCQYAIRKHFGSWNNLVETCNLKFNRVTGTEKDELIERVLRLAKEIGRTPTTREFNENARKNNLCSTMVINRYFGTYTKFIEHCGLEPNIRRIYKKKGTKINEKH